MNKQEILAKQKLFFKKKSQVQTLELKYIIFEILKNNWMGITADWVRQNKNQLM